MKTTLVFTSLLLPLGLAFGAQLGKEPSPETLARKSILIKPTADELRWQQKEKGTYLNTLSSI
jgi:hypothetical protein